MNGLVQIRVIDNTESTNTFQTLAITLVINRYKVFLRDLYINFHRYYNKSSTTLFIRKNDWFSADSCCTDKTKSMVIF